MSSRVIIFLAFFLLQAGCALGKSVSPSGEGVAPGMIQRAEAATAIVREAYDPVGPGAAFLISRNGKTLSSGAVGYANLEWQQEMKADTPVRIGSLSKPITAILALQLVESRRLELDQPIATYAPQLPAHYGAVTMRQLLSHRSGLQDFIMSADIRDHIWLPITTDRLIELAQDKPISFPPGERYEYANFNYVLVAHVMEKIVGLPYTRIVNDFFASHKMANSHFDVHGAVIPHRAAGYEIRDGKVRIPPGLDMSHTSAAGALLSSAEDLNRWIFLLTTGALVKPDSLKEAWTAQPLPDGAATSYGLGFNVGEFCGVRAIWHTGSAPGGQAAFLFIPQYQLFTAVLSNAYNTPNTGRMTRKMMAAMLKDESGATCPPE